LEIGVPLKNLAEVLNRLKDIRGVEVEKK